MNPEVRLVENIGLDDVLKAYNDKLKQIICKILEHEGSFLTSEIV